MTTITNNLLAFYNLDNTADSSSNNRTLTNVGNTTFASGKIGNAAVFDGTDKVLKSESISVAGSSELTFSFWIKTSNFSQPGCNLVGIWGNSNSSDTQFEAYYDSSNVVGLIQTPDGQGDRGMLFAPTNLSIADGNWHHFVMVFKGGNKVYGIYDGVKTQVNNFNSTTISNNSAYFGIGRTSQTAWGGANHFDGEIDAVGIWNRALSDAEVASLYNSGKGGEVIEGVWTPVDPYLINGVATTLSQNGTGTWNNQLYINGSIDESYTGWLSEVSTYYIGAVETTLNQDGTGTWNNQLYIEGSINDTYTGWLSEVSKYYIDGAETSLNSSGTGSYQDIFYIEGQQALTLDSAGNGDWNGQHYCYGNVIYTGWDSFLNIYYFEGQQTTLDSDGRGTIDGKYYISGSIANGWDWGQWTGYYIDGVYAPLNPYGFGTWDGVFYADGSPNANYTGQDWWDYVFYLNSQLTTLDIDGNGTWNGGTYVNGVLQGGGGGSVNLTSGLQAFYKLSDTSDSSGNNRTLTNNGNVSFASGKIGNAAVFDGQSSIQTSINTGYPFTMSFWTKPENGSGQQIILEPYNGWDGPQIVPDFNVGKMAVGGYGTYPGNLADMQVGVWQHYVVTFFADRWKVTRNGSETVTGNHNFYQPLPPITVIGTRDDGSLGYTGSLDAIGFWNRELNDAEVAALYNSGTGLEVEAPVVDLEDGLQAFYKLSDLSDSSGNNRTLTNNGNVSFASGKIGNAAEFVTGKHISLGTPFNLSQGTVAGWVKINHTETKQTSWWGGYEDSIISLCSDVENTDTAPMFEVCYMSEGAAGQDQLGDRLRLWNGQDQFFAGSATGDGQWHFFAVRHDNGTWKMQVDSLSGEMTSYVLADANLLLRMGTARGETDNLEGQIDAVGIWNRALSDAEVAALYNSGNGIEIDGNENQNLTLVKLQAPVKFFGNVKFGT